MKKKDHFYHLLIAMVIPITIQNFISALSSSADVIMLGSVNQESLSAVSLAGQITFVFNLLMMGMTIGSGMMVSQYYGKKDNPAIEKIMGFSTIFSSIMGITFFALSICIPEKLMELFTPDTTLIILGARYLKIVGITYAFMSISQIYLSVIRSMQRVKIGSIITTVSLCINICLNALLIYGFFGLPKLGIEGVAIATVVARAVELIWCILDSKFAGVIHYKKANIFHLERVFLKDFWHYTLPVIGNEIVWGVAFTSFSAIIGHVNSDFVAANSIASVIRNLAIVVCRGIASGGTVIIGNNLGEGAIETARKNGSRLCKLAIASGAVAGLTILAMKPLIFSLVDISPTAATYLNGMLYIGAYYCIGMSINSTTIAGIFCAGGDTKFGLKCDALIMWGITLPLGLIAAFVLKLPPVWIYFVLSLDELAKVPFVYHHYKKYQWLKNITR